VRRDATGRIDLSYGGDADGCISFKARSGYAFRTTQIDAFGTAPFQSAATRKVDIETPLADHDGSPTAHGPIRSAEALTVSDINACQNAGFKPNIFSGFVWLRQRRGPTAHEEDNDEQAMSRNQSRGNLPKPTHRLLLVNAKSDKRQLT
jgi:hypothetical protein